MVTIYDIAKKANCSAMTVSRVINNSGRISEQTRKRVLAIMREMNYVPNSTARSLVLQKTGMLYLLITDITNPFYTSLARGAEDAAKQLGYRLLLANSDEDVEKELEYIDTVITTRADGVLLAPAGDRSAANLAKLTDRNMPIVLLDREVPGATCDIVMGDSKEGARQLVDYLIRLGHRRIAFINGSTDTSTARLRLEGYREALESRGLPAEAGYIAEANYNHPQIEDRVNRMFRTPAPPTALFAANNFLALGATRSLRKLGFRVPEDVSVVCFDDLEADYVVDPFMTVMAQPAYDFGFIGIEMLVERIKRGQPDGQRRVILQPKLIERRSAAAPR